MARSLRGEYAGACYHVMARGNRRESALFPEVREEIKKGAAILFLPRCRRKGEARDGASRAGGIRSALM